MENIVLFAIPIFIVLIVVEFFYGLIHGSNTYDVFDTISNLIQGLISRLSEYVNQFFHIGIYAIFYHWIWKNYENPFWNSAIGIFAGIVIFDFFDYWLHRTEHESAIFWASHVVHHQSKHFNLSVALRQVSTEPILGFVYYLPMAIIGIPPQQLLLTFFMILFYQFWIHTEHIGKLGWFDFVFNSPSNHRVHHAINPQYLDRNYGGFLMIWDHLFKTYEPEMQTCKYGTKKPFNSFNPVQSILSEYISVFNTMRITPGLVNKCRSVFNPPALLVASIQSNEGKGIESLKHTDHSAVNVLKNQAPILKSGNNLINKLHVSICSLQFFMIAGLTLIFLIYADVFVYSTALQIIGAIVALCWVLGVFMMHQIGYFRLFLYNLIFISIAVNAGIISTALLN